jgi:hypothetical protein
MRRFRFIVGALLSISLLLVGCAAQKHRETVMSGVLTRGTPQKAFIEVWGPPERTRTQTTDTEEKRLEFSRWGGFYGRSERTYEIWEYSKRGAILIFYDGELNGWKTDKTTDELSTK